MAEDIKDDSILEAAMPPNMSIIKEEISVIEDEKLSLIKPDLGTPGPNEGNKGNRTSMTLGCPDQFPKPIIVPKIEVAVTNNTTPKLVDMLDIETESESEDSTDENTVSINDKSNTIVTRTMKQCQNKTDSDLVSEEIDLGTNVVTKDGDVKIYGLADNLGLHLPNTVFGIGKKLNVMHDSKTGTESNVKLKNVARKKTTITTIVSEKSLNKGTHKKPLKTISKIVFENKDIKSNADSSKKSKNEEFFGNKIILGNRSKSKIGEASIREVNIVAEDCYSEYINNPNYCTDCDILFTTYKSFDIHYIKNHLNNNNEDNETQSEDLDVTSKESQINNVNDKNVDVKPKKATKETKVTNMVKKDGEDAKFRLYMYKCKICSTVISNLSNIKRHINNIHNAQADVDLFEKFKVGDSDKSSSSDAKLQYNSGVHKSVKKDKAHKKNNSVIATNISTNSCESSHSSDRNIVEHDDEYDIDDEMPLKDKPTKTKTNKDKKSSVNPNPKNIADLVSKIKNNHCIHCDKTFTNKEEIINHLYDLLLPQIYTCNLCREEFVTEYNLKQHVKSRHDGVRIEIARLSEKEINKYIVKNANDKSSFENDSDDDTGDFERDFDDETSEIDATNNVGSPESTGNMNDVNNDVDSNKGINTKVVKFKCKLCFSTTCNLGNMNRHIKNIHHTKPETDLFKRVIVSKNNLNKVKSQKKAVKDLESITHNESLMEASGTVSDNDNFSEEPYTFIDEQNKIKDSPKIIGKDIQSKNDNHSKTDLNNKRVTARVIKSTLKSVNTSSSPVPKSVLFKCKTCDLHYISCWAARTHVNKCSGPKPAWECPDCFKTFKLSNKEMHERQHQCLGDEKFVIHTMDRHNRNALSIRVLHCCPKCGVHYSESRFTKHYTECEQDVPDSYFCLKCDMLIGEVHKDEHNKLHTFNKYNVEDFIIIEYESTEADQDDIIRIDKDETDITSPEPVDSIDIDTMSDDSQSEVVVKRKTNLDDKPNDSVTKADSRVARLIYCDYCKTYISPFKPNNLAHFYGYCSNLLKTTCTDCGLAFTCRSIYSHRNLHKRIRNFSIFNLVFYNMKFEQIDPLIPELPKCSHCLLNFECLDSKINHECGESKFKSCYYCGDDFNELSYKTHILFHEYVNKKSILPMNSDDILKIQTIIKKKAMGSTYNFTFYQCEECEVVLDEVDRDMHKNAKGNCLDLSHTYKKCFKCQLTILAKEFAHHSARHERNMTFKLENFNIIPFQRKNKAETTVKSASDKIKKSWCAICKINVFESAQRHSLKHANNSVDTNNHKEARIKPLIKRKRKIDNDEKKVNDKKKKTEIDRSTDSDYHSEIMDTADSSVAEVMQDHSDPKCSDKEAGKSSTKFKLKFYKKDCKAHESEKAITCEGEKENENSAKKTDANVEKIYRCLCELNFLTKAGILNHYSHCNIGSRIVKQNCTKCNLVFTPPVLFNHLVTHHSKNREFNYEIVNLTEYTSENRDEIYQCEICNAHFVVRELCVIHIENCKADNRRLIKRCPVCSLYFHIEALSLHRRKHHTAKQMTIEDFDTLVIKPKTKEQAEITHNEKEETSVKAQEATAEDTPATVHLNTIDNINIDSEIVSTTRNLERVADKIFKSIVLENYSNVIYKCDRCDLHFTGHRGLKAHFDRQHAQNIILVNCSVCLLRFSSETCLRHEYIHHKKLNLKLEDFEIRTDFDKPKKEKKDPSEEADFPTFTLSEEAKEKIRRNKKLISNKIYKCSQCDVYFMTPNTAFIHVRRFNHRLSRKVKKCDICDISMSAQTLERHKFIHHEINNYTFKDLKVKVDVTYCYTKSIKHFNKSLIDLNKYSNKIYKCLQCDLCHITFGALTMHVINNNHEIKTRKIKCSVCKENFAPLGLVKHKYIHHKVFKLNKNEFEFKDEVSLNDLIEKRRDEKTSIERQLRGSKQTILYRCKECNVCLLTRKTWKIHNYVHIPLLKRQKKQCDVCGLSFKGKALKWHKKVHHVEKGYVLNDFWIEERVL